ncbi:MAG: hypothetical protein ACLT3I_04855 [Ruminococcus sp.]
MQTERTGEEWKHFRKDAECADYEDQRNCWKEDEVVCSVMKQYEERSAKTQNFGTARNRTAYLVMVEAKDADLM